MDVNKYSQECKLRLAASIYFFKKITGHNLFPVLFTEIERGLTQKSLFDCSTTQPDSNNSFIAVVTNTLCFIADALFFNKTGVVCVP